MAKPKMAMIPSTVGGSVYSVLPSNGDGDFNFTRASAATRINAQGLIETVAATDNRLNYPLLDGTVQTCPHLLLEPQRTNLITYSESFSNAYWIKSGSSITSNAAISPDGTLNADKASYTSSGYPQLISSFTGTAATTYTLSFWLKLVSGTPSPKIELYGAGVINATSTPTFTNEWVRYTLTGTTTSAGSFSVYLGFDYVASATGEVLIYGAQLEQGSYSTSYIVSNSGSATTRIAEECNGSGNASTFNGSEGVLFVQMSALANNATTRRINLRNSSGSNQIRIEYGSSSNLISGVLFNGSNQAVINNTSYNVIDLNKIAFKYKENDFALWINGVKVGVDTSGTTIGAGILDRIDLSLATTETYSNVKQIQYFDSALNDSELETLTSWTSFSEMATSQLYSIQ
jgi:hypothetical protein